MSATAPQHEDEAKEQEQGLLERYGLTCGAGLSCGATPPESATAGSRQARAHNGETVLPSLQRTVTELQKRQNRQKHSDVFVTSPVLMKTAKMGNRTAYDLDVRRDLGVVTNEYVGRALIDKGTASEKFWAIWSGCRDKDVHIKGIQATDHMLRLCSSCKGVFDIVRSEITVCHDSFGYDADIGENSNKQFSDAVQELLAVLMVMMYLSFPAKYAEVIRDYKPRLDPKKPQHRPDLIGQLLKKPMPEYFRGMDKAKWKKTTMADMPEVADESSMSGVVIDQSWLGDDSPLAWITLEWAWSMGLNDLDQYAIGLNMVGKALGDGNRNDADKAMLDLVSVDIIVMSSFRRMLNSLRSQLETNLEVVKSWESRIIGLLVMVGTNFLGFFITFLQKNETALNEMDMEALRTNMTHDLGEAAHWTRIIHT